MKLKRGIVCGAVCMGVLVHSWSQFPQSHEFKSEDGSPLVPYSFMFKTKD